MGLYFTEEDETKEYIVYNTDLFIEEEAEDEDLLGLLEIINDEEYAKTNLYY